MAGVIVWSFLNDRRLWSPYEPNVSHALELAHIVKNKISLGNFSPSLLCYEVDFKKMTQSQIYTGSSRQVQRSNRPPTSPLSRGVVWEFEGDKASHWTTYDLDTMEVLEEAFSKYTQSASNSQIVNLHQSPLHQPYIIDFGNMTQKRKDTHKVRRIQRRFLNQNYTPAVSTNSTAVGMTAAFALQALTILSTTTPPSSSLFVSTSLTSQGLVGAPYSSAGLVNSATAYVGKQKSTGHKTRSKTAPYKLNSGQTVAPGTSLPQQGPAAQSGYPNYHAVQQCQGLQQQPQHQLNSQGAVTRSRLQQMASNFGFGSQLSTTQLSTQQPQLYPILQQQQQPLSSFQSSMRTSHMSSNGLMNHALGHVTVMHPSNMYMHSRVTPLSSRTTVPPQPIHPTQQMPQSSLTVLNPAVQESLPTEIKITIGKSKKTKPKTGLEVLSRYMTSIQDDLDKTDCSICFEKLSEASSYGDGQPDAHDAVKLFKCGHQFHKLCLLEMYNSVHKDDCIQCPSCKTIYGEKTGICPPGFMQWRIVDNLTLAGYEGYGTICVTYHISPGIQGPEHPSPGQKFSALGFPRQGFIPDCDKGRKVLKLLIEAFRRRLMFTIGTSHTTGEINTVTWNEIHHKTEPQGNFHGHGYPDPNYLENVLLELSAHGVTDDCLK